MSGAITLDGIADDNSLLGRHENKAQPHRRSLSNHRNHGAGAQVKLGHALAGNSTMIATQAMHANGTAVIAPTPETKSKSGEGRRAQKRATRAAAEQQHAGIERKYGAGGK